MLYLKLTKSQISLCACKLSCAITWMFVMSIQLYLCPHLTSTAKQRTHPKRWSGEKCSQDSFLIAITSNQLLAFCNQYPAVAGETFNTTYAHEAIFI